jgi:hypothetical protein
MFLRIDHADQSMVNEGLQKWRHVARHRLRIDVVIVAQSGENLTDPARFGEHLPDLRRHGIEVEIRTGAHTQKHPATVKVGGDRLTVLNENAFDRDSQVRWTLQGAPSDQSPAKPGHSA